MADSLSHFRIERESPFADLNHLGGDYLLIIKTVIY